MALGMNASSMALALLRYLHAVAGDVCKQLALLSWLAITHWCIMELGPWPSSLGGPTRPHAGTTGAVRLKRAARSKQGPE